MDSSSQVAVLQKDVQQLEQMNGSLLDRVALLERELALAQSRASDAEAKLDVVSAERDVLRSKLAQSERTSKETGDSDLRSAFIEIERFEALLRTESEQRAQLETQLAWRQKQDIENGLSHSLEVSELERMNAMLAAENASLQENMKKLQDTGSQAPINITYKSEFSMEPCAEPEQDETNTARNDSSTQL